MKTKIVEQKAAQGVYEFLCQIAIVDHPKFGRLLIREGFAGRNEHRGGMYRWCDGSAIRLKKDDTFASLESLPDWSEGNSHYVAIINGYDSERPYLDLTGAMVEKIAESAGL